MNSRSPQLADALLRPDAIRKTFGRKHLRKRKRPDSILYFKRGSRNGKTPTTVPSTPLSRKADDRKRSVRSPPHDADS